jgi:hypothetical protein
MKKTSYLALLIWLVLAAPVFATDLYQWTDARGVIHFTDHLNNVPAAVRASGSFTVRQNFLKPSEAGPPAPVPALPSLEIPAQPASERVLPNNVEHVTTVHHQPQEITIIVVTSQPVRRANRCIGDRCAPAFRPDFNDRRYIHPSVFDNGGSRQYIQP